MNAPRTRTETADRLRGVIARSRGAHVIALAQRILPPEIADAVAACAPPDLPPLSARRYAMDVLLRDERTVRRWLAGEGMPDAVLRAMD